MSTELQTTTDKLTLEMFQRALPRGLRVKATADMVQKINGLLNDQLLRETYRDNLMSYTHVLQDGKYKLQSYLDAVRYVSFKLMGLSNQDSYIRTFPDRYQRLLGERADEKVISSYVAAYNKNQLVNKILEQSMVPTWVVNADVFQEAINTQAYLMRHSSSDKVRTDAANSILNHLKPPEAAKIEIDVTQKQDKQVDALRETVAALVKQQKSIIQNGGMSVQEVAHSKIIKDEDIEDAEYTVYSSDGGDDENVSGNANVSDQGATEHTSNNQLRHRVVGDSDRPNTGSEQVGTGHENVAGQSQHGVSNSEAERRDKHRVERELSTDDGNSGTKETGGRIGSDSTRESTGFKSLFYPKD